MARPLHQRRRDRGLGGGRQVAYHRDELLAGDGRQRLLGALERSEVDIDRHPRGVVIVDVATGNQPHGRVVREALDRGAQRGGPALSVIEDEAGRWSVVVQPIEHVAEAGARGGSEHDEPRASRAREDA
jgi:hypothetical protein